MTTDHVRSKLRPDHRKPRQRPGLLPKAVCACPVLPRCQARGQACRSGGSFQELGALMGVPPWFWRWHLGSYRHERHVRGTRCLHQDLLGSAPAHVCPPSSLCPRDRPGGTQPSPRAACVHRAVAARWGCLRGERAHTHSLSHPPAGQAPGVCASPSGRHEGSLHQLGSSLAEEEGHVSLARPAVGQQGPCCQVSQLLGTC